MRACRWWVCCGFALVGLVALAGCGAGGEALGPPSSVTVGAATGTVVIAPVGSALTVTVEGASDLVLGLVSTARTSGSLAVTVNDGTTSLPPLSTRADEPVIHDRGTMPVLAVGGLAVTPTRQVVGSTRTFTTHDPSGSGYVRITARLRAVGAHCLVYANTAIPTAAFDASDAADVRNQWDSGIHPTDTGLFGSESDVDANDKVLLLFTELEANTGGYFDPNDLVAGRRNDADMVYCRAPRDQDGARYADARNRLLSTLAHELQHLINFNQKRLLRGVGPEEVWISEGLSNNAAQENGFLDLPANPPDFVARWFTSPETYTLQNLDSNYKIGHSGVAYLFIRYLVGRYGQSVYGSLVRGKAIGTANVAAATGRSFASLATEFTAAAMLSGTGLTSDNRYEIAGFDTHGSYLGGTLTLRGPRMTVVDGASGRPAFRAALPSGGIRYLRVRGLPTNGGLLRLTGGAGGVYAVLMRIPSS